MMHEIEKLDSKGLRKFGLVTGAIVGILFGIFLPWVFERGWPSWPWYISGILWVLALMLPVALNPVYFIWMRIGILLGWVNTRIILGIVFYVIFTPISVLFAVLGKDPMHRKHEPDSSSYRINTENHPREHMERPY